MICQLPTGNGFRFEWELVDRLKIYQTQVIIFIQDTEAFIRESHPLEWKEKIRLYNRAAVLIVPSLAMRQFLLDHGLREDMKFVIQEIWDYTTDMISLRSPLFRREIYFMGNGGIDGTDNWNYTPLLKLHADSAVQGQNVQCMGKLSREELFFELSKGGLGWYGMGLQIRGKGWNMVFLLNCPDIWQQEFL